MPFGPYDTEAQAAAEPLPQEIRALHDAGRIRSGDPDRLLRNTNLRHLVNACDQAGVQVGEYDMRVLAWLAGWEPEVVQAVIGLVSRAHAAGWNQCADESGG